ncbi:MAG: DUF4129 domain-containing protein [Coleofasciculaceae cyanobacterium SM2_1_6]|nr:DUF4129 domain-containing protein [Coleofasciculaceae cyanobacterium SM2_1_6]
MDEFEDYNWDWQLQQWGQQLGEWWELRTQQLTRNLPDFSLADWLKYLALPPWVYQLLFWLLLGLAFLALGLLLGRVGMPFLKNYLQKLQDRSNSTKNRRSKPLVTKLPVNQWLRRSQQFQTQGNYAEACRCLYFALLQQLDDREIVPQQLSRTDREYQELLAPLPQISLYQILLRTHEELCFSSQPISAERFTQCQQALEEILNL